MRSSFVLAATLLGCSSPPARPALIDHATVPLVIEGNRPLVTITFKKADGTSKDARFLIDTGGGGFLFVEPLAKDLGLALGPAEKEDEGDGDIAPVTSPVHAFIGDLPLELNPKRMFVLVGQTNMLPPVAPGHADGLLPGHVLAQYHVVLDYPKATLTLAKPGAVKPVGTPLAMPVQPESGFPRTEITIDGTPHGMILDTGASFTMVSEALLKSLGDAHPDWQRHQGAFGEAATLGGQTLETMFVPKVDWGGNALADVGVTSQHEGVFEKWMSGMMTAPIIGSLAGNVLKQFRVDLDYPNQTLYLSRP